MFLSCNSCPTFDNHSLVPSPNAPGIFPGPWLGLAGGRISWALLVGPVLSAHRRLLALSASSMRLVELNFGRHLPRDVSIVEVHHIVVSVLVERPTVVQLVGESVKQELCY